MKKLYYILFILSSLIIGIAANINPTTGIFSGEVQDSWTIGIPDVEVIDVVRSSGVTTDWGGEFSYARVNMQAGTIDNVLFSFKHPGYKTLTDEFPIKAGYEGYYEIPLTEVNPTR